MLAINAFNQNSNITLEKTLESRFLYHVDTSAAIHSSIKPLSRNDFSALNVSDHRKIVENTDSNSFLNRDLLFISNDNATIRLNPIINAVATGEASANQNNLLKELALGVNLQATFRDKWSGQLAFLVDHSTYPQHIASLIEHKNVSPGYGYSKNDQSYFTQGNITFRPNDIFTLEAGYGKNFLGDGYRSLFLSDHANSYPYLKVTGQIWKIKYMSLYTNFKDIGQAQDRNDGYRNKFSTIHYLSWNATKWLNFGLFETIIWQSKEGNFFRGYDLNYFNPILLLRPTEFAQGSADNALLGGSFKITIKKRHILYGQLLLDEFLLDELRAGNGWWANKYGIQSGLKSYDLFGVKRLWLQMEYNVVRPFTYSYYYQQTPNSALQNYGHFNLPLAHPLGANFNEAYIGLNYNFNRWIIEAKITAAKTGFDTDTSFSIGQDVFLPYNLRENEYGHSIAQGLTTNIINKSIKASYMLHSKSNLALQLGINHRTFENNNENTSLWWFQVGIKTLLINRYSDF